MEKICIVKRRQQYAHADNLQNIPDSKVVEELDDCSGHIVSIIMTKEQSDILQKSEYIKDLLDEKKNDPKLDVNLNSEGLIILKLHLNNSLLLRMLRCDQVCQMLQISRSFLQKLIHENKLKSYKIGRLRRFLLEDILEFLLNNEKFDQFKEVN
ncbi:MAG: helix-turn-helix domain-containing protein [Smithellaceae bacterium]|jgi:excisionase family DNA binding protein